MFLAGGDHLHEFRIERFPVPLGAGEIGLRRQRRLVDVIAADHGAAARGVLDHGLRAVDVAGQDVDALVDQAVGGFGFLDRHRPVAGEDHLRGGLRIGEPGAEREGVDVAQHLRDRLGGDEAELAGLGRIAGDDAGDVLRLVDIAEIAAGVLRVLVGPQAAAMLEAQLRILVGHLDHVRIVVAERGREQQRRAVEIDHRLHGLFDRVGLRDLFFLDHLDAGHLLQRRGALRVGLVVAVVVARADIDEADRGVRGRRGTGAERRAERQRGAALQEMPS